MPSISKILIKFAQSSSGQKLYNNVLAPKNEKLINSTLPVVQTAVAEICGLGITAFNPKIECEQKKQQMISHGLKAGMNLTIVGLISSATAEFANGVAKNINAPDGVKAGIKIGFPLLVATLTSRFIIPVFLNNASTKIRDKVNDFYDKRKKIDLKA